MSLSTHSVLAARESTLFSEAGKRKRGRPRKFANADGIELATTRPLRMDASNMEISQVNSEVGRENVPVSLLLACYYIY